MKRFGILISIFAALIWCTVAKAQEAVDLERSAQPSPSAPEQTPPKKVKTTEKVAAEPTPIKSSSEKTADEETAAKIPKRVIEQVKSGKSVEEVMRPEEFRAAGLDKLSEDELQHLDAWLQGYRQTTEKKASERAEVKATEEIKKAKQEAVAEQPRTKMDSLVSRVDGRFAGLKGRTIIRLEDGTVWKQANFDDHFSGNVPDHPAAAVIHSVFGYKMRIEGVATEFYVDPVSK